MHEKPCKGLSFSTPLCTDLATIGCIHLCVLAASTPTAPILSPIADAIMQGSIEGLGFLLSMNNATHILLAVTIQLRADRLFIASDHCFTACFHNLCMFQWMLRALTG